MEQRRSDGHRISVVINTYNAAEHLTEVLESVKPFDEILVCDMESTDETIKIARRFGCRIVTFPKGNCNICEPARNFAIQSASYDWVFVVDADEIIPQSLHDYLYDKIADNSFRDALAIPRINRFMGETFKAKTDYQVRFFRKDAVNWPETIHSNPEIDGKIIRLSAKEKYSLHHLDDPPVAKRLKKLNVYTDYDSEKRIGKRYGYFKVLVRPIWFFVRDFLLQRGFRHGKQGILQAYFTSVYQIMLMAKIFEKQTADKDS